MGLGHSVAVSGDIAITNAGVVTIQANAGEKYVKLMTLFQDKQK